MRYVLFGLWLLVQTISRRVDQLNFPMDGLAMAKGMTSEIVLLRKPDGSVRYTGWYRCLRSSGRSVYTGFYMTEVVPESEGACMKVVFPMPDGNATVILSPENGPDGSFVLASAGATFGGVGFYRIQRRRKGGERAWLVRGMKEAFRMYEDSGELRCEHDIHFMGMRVLSLHYRMHGAPRRSRDGE